MTTPLPGIVETATPGAGVDTVDRPTKAESIKYAESGFKFWCGYVDDTRGVAQPGQVGGGITRRAVEWLLEAGLAVMPVQFAVKTMTASRGARAGSAAAANARELGFGDGCTLWCDLEGVGGSTAADIIAYCNAWHVACADGGYHPGLYVGTRKLTAEQLYQRLKFNRYWTSAMDKMPVPLPRGYCMAQTRKTTIHGVTVDADALWADELAGPDDPGLPYWQVIPAC